MTQYALLLEGMTHPGQDVDLRLKTQSSVRRQSNTVYGTLLHTAIHTSSPDASLHHIVTAASPHPRKSRADSGDYYMIAYVSIPMDWIEHVSFDFMQQWDVTFIGPPGFVQRLPPALSYMKDLMAPNFYLGFDWLYIVRQDQDGIEPKQPTREYIINKITTCMQALRGVVESNTK